MDLSIHQCAHRVGDHPPGETSIRNHIHQFHVASLHRCKSGVTVAGKERHMVSGPYLEVLSAGECDGNGLQGHDDAYWCLFSGDAVKAEPDGLRVTVQVGGVCVSRSHFRHPDPEEAAQLADIFRQLQQLSQRPDLSSRLEAVAYLARILAVWTSPEPATGSEPGVVRRYRALIEQNVANPGCSLAALAAQLNMTADHLAILFRRELGLTPIEYRTRLRLARACEMLISTSLSVAEITRLTGFADPNYFARIFRAKFHCSPREYARRNKLPTGS